MNLFQGVIDVYDGNDLDLADAWSRGVRVILHETSQGLYKVDKAYAARKQAAIGMGFLWAGFHLLSGEDAEKQLDQFLQIENAEDPRVALAIDWEASPRGTMSFPDLRRFIELFVQKMQVRYPERFPMLYGGNLIRESKEIRSGDALLAKCPLWYQRYTNGALEIPQSTWPTYTLWQFDDEHREYGGPPPDVLPGVDWSRYQGTIDDLRQAWPFGVAAVSAKAPSMFQADLGSNFADRLVGLCGQEWQFFGQQTYDLNGRIEKVGHKEGEDGWYQRIGTYWLDGVHLPNIDGRDHDVPWSAAFISWTMRIAGADQRFHYSAQHSVYIYQAIRDFLQKRDSAGYWCWRLNELKPSPGDVICWSREPGIDYDHQNGGDYKGHCDVIVEVNGSEVQVIGGNVGDSVTKRPIALDAAGFIKPTTENGENLFALMECRIASIPPITT